MIPERKHTKGGIREVLTIALPMVVSYACETVMIFTDRLFLSRLGPDMMNASMAGGITGYMLMTFFLGLCGYTTALAAQYFGAGRKDKSAVVVTQAALVAAAGYPLILLCRPLAYFMFRHSGIGPGQLVPQLTYFDTIILFCLFPLLRQTLSSYFTGIGRTRVVMIAAVTAMTVNVAANYVLIFGNWGFPALGIRGAAYGTVLGAFTGMAVLLGVYWAPRNAREFAVNRSLRFDKTIMTKLLRFGYPPGVEMFLNLMAFDLFVLIFHAVGIGIGHRLNGGLELGHCDLRPADRTGNGHHQPRRKIHGGPRRGVRQTGGTVVAADGIDLRGNGICRLYILCRRPGRRLSRTGTPACL